MTNSPLKENHPTRKECKHDVVEVWTQYFRNKPAQAIERWDKRFEKLIISKLFLAWEAGKKQHKTPTEYTLDTDKLGRPIFDMAISELSRAREEERERVRKWAKREMPSKTLLDIDKSYYQGYESALEDLLTKLK